MNEIEVKVLNIDKYEIEKKLLSIGASLIKDEEQVNIRFDDKESHLRKDFNGYLRIRITKDRITGKISNTLTFKKNISKNEFRVNEEIEIEISDAEKAVKIFENLGYVKKNPGLKNRKSFQYDNILFEIDEWDKSIYPKPYLEIEVKNEEDFEKAIKLLDIDRKNVTAKSIAELIKDVDL